jgi:hypothetical protein
MHILSHKITTTRDSITAQAGLLAPLQLMGSLGLTERINQHLPTPESNRGFAPSLYVQTTMLMLHAGGECLEDVRHLCEDSALLGMLDIKQFPSARALGDWLHRIGNKPQILASLIPVNQCFLQAALGDCKAVTLDIDACEIVANKKHAQWTYKGNKGYMPMVGHIAETDPVVAYDFREGNVPPNKDNLGFIKYCEQALPSGCSLKAVRIDAAGYQKSIIQYCHAKGLDFAIRVPISPTIKQWINERKGPDWETIHDDKGQPTLQSACCTSHCIGDHKDPFRLIIQRHPKSHQSELALDQEEAGTNDTYTVNGYIYRAIATAREGGSAKEIIDWYNQRGETSENRIKELKLDFNGDHLPCSDFKANALYFGICTLAYNLLALMRQLAPAELKMHRVKAIRWSVYQLAGKVVNSGRRLLLKVSETRVALFERLLKLFTEYRPPPQPTQT